MKKESELKITSLKLTVLSYQPISGQNNTDRYPLMLQYSPETNEIRTDYRILLGDYNTLLTKYSSLNSSYQRYLLGFSSLKANYTSLQNSFQTLNSSYNNLNTDSTITRLQHRTN